jgi:uncharacterized iron-regulated protein
VGRIWHGANKEFVEIQHLVNAIESASYLLLGEKHDNPDHHLLQLMVLKHVVEQMRVSVPLTAIDDDPGYRVFPLIKDSWHFLWR